MHVGVNHVNMHVELNYVDMHVPGYEGQCGSGHSGKQMSIQVIEILSERGVTKRGGGRGCSSQQEG